MTPSQKDFRAAILDPSLPVPEGLTDGHAAPAGTRFSVYRNNVVLSLTEALSTAFPLLCKLLGGTAFDRLAALYVRRHPPRSPLMMFFGEEMPAFLKGFEPVAHLGYLPDCARLDLALRHSYHAADAAPLDPALLQGTEEATRGLRVRAAPATRILRSDWPLYDIWRYNVEKDAPKPRQVKQDVLIARPEFDPKVHLLPEGGADWLDALGRGLSFGDACDKAFDAFPAFDLAAVLTLALRTRALTQEHGKDPT